MIRYSPFRGHLLRAAVLVGLLTAPVAANAAGGNPIEFWKRLVVPGGADRFQQPAAVHADLHTGEVFVCDRDNHRVVIFDARGLYRYQIPGGPVFRTPLDVAVDPEGYLFLLAYRERKRDLIRLDYDGRDPRPIDLGSLGGGDVQPQWASLAMSPAGDRLYLLDEADLALWIVSREGAAVRRIDLAVDSSGKEDRTQAVGRVDVYGDRVLVGMPMAGQVYLYDLDGNFLQAVGVHGTSSCQTAFPVAAALDRDGNLLVLDRQRTLFMRWSPEENRCLGEHSGIGTLDGFLYQPADLALDGEGRVYVSQGFEGRVQVFRNATPARTGSPGAPKPEVSP